MTNKMPVVGKRYRATEANEFIPNKDYIMRCDEILSDRVILDKDTRSGYIGCSIEDFFQYFEELPEDNLQENQYRAKAEAWELLDYNKKYKEKNSNKMVKLNSISTGEVMFRYEGENYEKGQYCKCSPSSFLHHFEELPEDNLQETKKVQINEKGEVSKVERALEELKRNLPKAAATRVEDNDSCGPFEDALETLIDLAKNLVDALEAKKKFPMKEEHIEPVSIWKNGDELEELEKRNEKFLVRTKDGRVTMPFLGNILIDKNIKEATTLTDLVNSIEQMQKDIEELKRKPTS